MDEFVITATPIRRLTLIIGYYFLVDALILVQGRLPVMLVLNASYVKDLLARTQLRTFLVPAANGNFIGNVQVCLGVHILKLENSGTAGTAVFPLTSPRPSLKQVKKIHFSNCLMKKS